MDVFPICPNLPALMQMFLQAVTDCIASVKYVVRLNLYWPKFVIKLTLQLYNLYLINFKTSPENWKLHPLLLGNIIRYVVKGVSHPIGNWFESVKFNTPLEKLESICSVLMTRQIKDKLENMKLYFFPTVYTNKLQIVHHGHILIENKNSLENILIRSSSKILHSPVDIKLWQGTTLTGGYL